MRDSAVFDQLPNLYGEAAREFIVDLPNDWTQAWLRQECMSGAWRPNGYYEQPTVAHITHFAANGDATELIHDAWELSVANKNPWSVVVMHLTAPDKMVLKFSFEDVEDPSVLSRDRRAAFERATFGDREIVSIIDMSGAVSLTPEMLRTGEYG